MRDLLVAAFIASFVFLAVRNPYTAFLLWTWAGLIAIDTYLFGFMKTIPLSMIFAATTLGLLLIPGTRGQHKYASNGVVVLFACILVHGFLAACLAYPGLDRNWDLYSNMVKTMLLCFLMPYFLINRQRINLYVMLYAIGVCFHGLIDGLKFVSSGGTHNAHGIAKHGDNNHYATILLMGMPLLLYIYRYTLSKWVKLGTLGVFMVTFLAVLATNSRGAIIAALAVGVWIIMMSQRKLAGLFTMGALCAMVMLMAPAQWFARMDTIKDANEDSSFMGRVTVWKRASAIALENPVFGGGYHAGQAPSIFEQFRYKQGLLGFVETPNVSYPAAAHSIYFEVLGDLGFVGLALFLTAIATAFYNWRRIRALADRDPARLGWASELANMVAASMVAYVVGGALLSLAYFEFPYYLIMLMQCIWMAIRTPIEDPSPSAPLRKT